MRTIRTYSAHGSTWGTGAHPTPVAARVAAETLDRGPIEVIRWRDGNADRPGLHGFGAFVAAGIHERPPPSGANGADK